VELNTTPPVGYNVFYAGWDNSNATPTSTACVHHPSGDIKKFSNDHDASVSDQYLGTSGINDSHWKIVMWDDGTTTEGGSSGSPLFDQNHRIVGQLHGGYASCSSLTSDWYGKFSMSWDRGTTNATQLEHWLDPTTTGTTIQNGYDPNSPSSAIDVQMLQIVEPQINYCSNPGSITPEVTIKNKGTTTITYVDLAYVLDGGTPVTTSWNGTLVTNGTTNVTFPAISLAAGSHTLEFYTYNPNSSVDQDLTNDTLSMSTNIGGTYTIPFFEDFESGTFPPDCWESYVGTNGLGTGYDWTTTTTAYTGVTAAYVRDEDVTGGDAEDWLVTPLIDMSSTINNELTFYERQRYNSDYGTDFYIKVSTTSQTTAASFTDVVTYGESTFGLTYTKRTVDLSAYDGQSIYVAFVMIQDDGDVWYVDSVYINGTIPAGAPDAEFSASTLTACPNTAITFTDATTNTPTSWAWTFTPSTVTYVGGTNASSQNPQVEFNAAGTYTVNLAATNAVITNNENKINYITINPISAAGFTFVDGPGTQVTFTDVSTNATSWAWDFGDGNTSTQQSPTHTYATSGSYTACLIATNACGSDTICQSVSIVSTGINTEDAQINVYPNPSNGRFILSMNTNGEEILLNVYNSTGQLVYTDMIAASQGEISYVINLSDLSAGVYILELNSETIHYIDRLLYK
jgi:PKD repeat protein